MLSGNIKEGGMIDGQLRHVVMFLDDGHPELAFMVTNVTGDAAPVAGGAASAAGREAALPGPASVSASVPAPARMVSGSSPSASQPRP